MSKMFTALLFQHDEAIAFWLSVLGILAVILLVAVVWWANKKMQSR